MLANTFQTLDALRVADIEALKKTPDVGDITAEWIVDFFQAPHNLEVLDRLLAAGIHWDAPVAPSRQPLNGESWVVTGHSVRWGVMKQHSSCKHWAHV
jgi:DNA ligase (NAD+)